MGTQTSFVLAGLVFTAGCSAPPTPASADRVLLFGLEAEEVEDAVALYAPDADADELVEQLAAPFDCARFASACEAVGPERAEELLEDMWTMARDGAPEQDIREMLAAAPPPGQVTSSSTVSVGVCGASPMITISVTATKTSFGLFSVGSVGYHARRTSIVGPAWGTVDHAVDATLELELSTPVGLTTFSGSTSVTAQAEASFAHLAAGPFFIVVGEVSAVGCPTVAVSF